jgi:formylglycine-generating enzyme required for sulfatase activity
MFFRLCLIASLLLCSAQAYADFDVFGTGANQFQIEFVTVGDPGNSPNPDQLDLGQVNYEYRIAKFEVSREMITKANSAGNLNLSMATMSSTLYEGPSRPATGLSWNEAARFVNWLNTSSGFMPAYKFDFQPGHEDYDSNDNLVLWTATEAGFNSANPFRNSLAKYFLPSIDEWHKAAYHDPTVVTVDPYWEYATLSNSPPVPVASGNNPTANEAVYNQSSTEGPAEIFNAGGLSYWGTMGQGGNVFEWNESSVEASLNFNPLNPSDNRFVRGGSWRSLLENAGAFAADLSANSYLALSPNSQDTLLADVGFRIASTSSAVPEPSSWILVSISAACGWIYKRRRSRVQKQPTQTQSV